MKKKITVFHWVGVLSFIGAIALIINGKESINYLTLAMVCHGVIYLSNKIKP